MAVFSDDRKRPELKIGMFYCFCCICDLQFIKNDDDLRDAYESVDDWFDEYGSYGKHIFFETWDDVLSYFKGYETDQEINAAKSRIF